MHPVLGTKQGLALFFFFFFDKGMALFRALATMNSVLLYIQPTITEDAKHFIIFNYPFQIKVCHFLCHLSFVSSLIGSVSQKKKKKSLIGSLSQTLALSSLLTRPKCTL